VNGSVKFQNGTTTNMIVTTDGKVGIGTNDTKGYKLAVAGTLGVKGKITAEEIQVIVPAWSDYVFKSDYNLRSLKDVEGFIKQNGHLPEIPSEKEVTENGVQLGEMNALLLKKIEELTLYVIEQNKTIQTMQAQLTDLQK
jgi:hypothetical protein